MKKTYLFTTFLIIFAVFLFDIFYITLGGLPIKSTASALFVLLGIVNFVFAIKLKPETKNNKYMIFMLIGLVFACAGDIVLNLHFISGAALFAVGHLFFFVSYCMISKICLRDLICGLCIFVPSLLIITLVPAFDFGGVLMEVVCVIYALIISFMVGKSISNLIASKSLNSVLTVIGSCMFFVSDFMLLLSVFGGIGWAGVICLATYYPAECLLATTIFTAKNSGNK